LKLRNRDVLDGFLKNISKNPVGAKPMSNAQFLANHAPTQSQAQAVANYLTGQGYRNVTISTNRMLVSADGTAATAARAFTTSFAQVRTRDGRIAFMNKDEVRIPAALSGTVLSVIGLQTVNQTHIIKPVRPKTAGTNAIIGHNPLEFSSIYGATGVTTAAGVTVGIFTSGDVSQAITDLGTFTTNNHLAPVTTSVVTTNGTSTDLGGTVEWDLDSQDIVGMGGGAVGQLIFYSAPTLSNADMAANFNTIVTANAAKIINVSIGGCEVDAEEDGTAAAVDQILAVGDTQGQTFSISTGDSGADECFDGGLTPSWPADSPYVIAVAGTTLDASTTAWNSEVVWGGTGGSPSTFEPMPIWQRVLASGNFRGVADVAFDADPNSGSAIIVNGGLQQWGGTSLAAPIFSGMWARVLAAKGTSFGFAGPLIYSLPQADFHDITSGNNFGEPARTGYDFVSGRGSIVLSSAINHIGKATGQPPTANFTFLTNGLAAHFTDTSTDADGTIIKHIWNFGDGSAIVEVANPGHAYAGAGTYNVSETVADNDLNVVTKTEQVTVAQPVNSLQRIQNSGFETGITPWVLSGNATRNNGPTEPPHGGQWDVVLDGQGKSHTDSVAQTLHIDSVNRTSAALNFWLHVDTNEISKTRQFDKLNVGLYTTGGALIAPLASYSNLDAAPGYALHSVDVSSFIGQTVVVKFSGTEDSSLQTTFALDDVTLTEH